MSELSGMPVILAIIIDPKTNGKRHGFWNDKIDCTIFKTNNAMDSKIEC